MRGKLLCITVNYFDGLTQSGPPPTCEIDAEREFQFDVKSVRDPQGPDGPPPSGDLVPITCLDLGFGDGERERDGSFSSVDSYTEDNLRASCVRQDVF